MFSSFRHYLIVVLTFVLFVSACDSTPASPPATAAPPTVGPVANAIQISVIYAPECERYMTQAITDFNQAYANGLNPLTGNALGADERPIYVTGKNGSSGVVMQGIVNAVLAPNNANVEKPTIYIPAVSTWLALGNYRAGRPLFDLAESQSTALSAVVIAIWKSRYDAIQQAYPGEQLGWKQLIDVIKKGWNAYGLPGRNTVYYGHTDPYISSTGLSTLLMEYYASARYNAGFNGRRLTLKEIDDKVVKQGVHDLQEAIKHYSKRTTEFKNYIAKGPDYLDFTALPENELLQITEGKTGTRPPEPLIALYPSEGTFWHDYPFSIVNADWVTPEQRQAATLFRQYVLSAPIQQAVLAGGFRPVNPKVKLSYPYVADLGVDTAQPYTVLDLPEPEVIAEIQQSWSYVKKQADIWLVVDISGSMAGDKLDQARKAAVAFVENLDVQNRVGLIVFNDQVNVAVEMDILERNKAALEERIKSLNANGGTALYDALLQSTQQFGGGNPGERIRAVVLLSDGQSTEGKFTLSNVTEQINASGADTNPIIVIPVAYGNDADIAALNAIAMASKTTVQPGDPKNIKDVLDVIASYF